MRDVVLGVGDDAALLTVPPGHELVACTDTLVDGRHFPAGTRADDVGWRSLAVNLSDLAAMGATPAWATLALTLPAIDEDWLEGFVTGFAALATAHQVALVGGDTTRGPLTITVQALGLAPAGTALRRRGAQPGRPRLRHRLAGDAAAGLALIEGRLAGAGADRAALELKFRRPEPRVAFGSGCAASRAPASTSPTASRRISGGSRPRAASGPRSAPRSCRCRARSTRSPGESRAREFALGGGDDYELLFSGAAGGAQALAAVTGSAGAPACHCIGEIGAGRGVRVLGERGELPVPRGWDHFRDVTGFTLRCATRSAMRFTVPRT